RDARHRAHRGTCDRGRLRGLEHLAPCIRGGPGFRAGALPGPAIRRADRAAPQTLRASRRRPRPPRRPGAQRRGERRRGGFLSRRSDPSHRSPMIAGEPAYAAFAARLTAGGGISDPWLEGRPRFHPEPVVLGADEQSSLYRVAEEMAAAWNELCLLCAARPDLVSGFLGLS